MANADGRVRGLRAESSVRETGAWSFSAVANLRQFAQFGMIRPKRRYEFRRAANASTICAASFYEAVRPLSIFLAIDKS